MGAKGGYRMVRAWKCTTCDELYGIKADAVECCNERLWEERSVQRKAKAKRTYTQTSKRLRIHFKTMENSYGVKMEYAVAGCPRDKSRGVRRKSWTIAVPKDRPWTHGGRKYTREEGRRVAAALVKAQLARHLKSCYCARSW
jgi:hypothetical protein